MPFLFVLALLLTPSPAPSAAPPAIDTPQALIEAMRARYDGRWYETLTFVQTSIRHNPDGSADTSLWYEALQMPGHLRIDFDPIAAGNGILFRRDTVYSIQNGAVAGSRPQVHSLLLLGFDVYFLPPETTLARLETLGFDLTKMHERTWQGRPVYVVGADPGDETSPQFWIDSEHLYFVRERRPVGGDQVQDIRFNRYEKAGDGWIAPEVLFYVGDRLVFEEHYDDVRTGMTFDPALFDPARWTTATHWR